MFRERAEVDESSGRVNMRALSTETDNDNGASCATCREVRRETKRTAVHMKLFTMSPDL